MLLALETCESEILIWELELPRCVIRDCQPNSTSSRCGGSSDGPNRVPWRERVRSARDEARTGICVYMPHRNVCPWRWRERERDGERGIGILNRAVTPLLPKCCGGDGTTRFVPYYSGALRTGDGCARGPRRVGPSGFSKPGIE